MTEKEMFDFIKNNPSELYEVSWENHTEVIYFWQVEDISKDFYFHSPVVFRKYNFKNDEEFLDMMKYLYAENLDDKIINDEKQTYIDGVWYELDYPQTEPFLPNNIDDIKPISNRNYILNYILKN